MTASEILNISVTVAICQICLDLFTNWFYFKSDDYKRACSALERSEWKKNKAESDYKEKGEKQFKRYQRAKDDYSTGKKREKKKHTHTHTHTHMSHLKNPLVNDFSKRYHLRRENGSAEARRKRGGRSAEATPFRRKRRGSPRKRGGRFAEATGADVTRRANRVV